MPFRLTHQARRTVCNQGGNALFLILIAVVLFAVLSYSVTRSSRSGGPDIADDKAEVAADILINYTTLIRQNITRMMLSNDLEWWEIDFSQDPSVHENPNCTVSTCMLFHPDGGGVPPLSTIPVQALKTGTTSSTPKFQLVIVENIGTTSPDIIFKALDLSANVCSAINTKINITGYPPYDTSSGAINLANGEGYTVGGHSGTTIHIGNTAPTSMLAGKDMGCGCKLAACSSASDYRFYAVIHQE